MRIRVVWLADRAGRISFRAGAGGSPQLADDSGAAHRPSGTRVECAGRHAVLAIRPPHAVSIHGRPVCRVRHEDVGEAEAIGLLNVPVARQRQDSRCPAAVTAVVPESGADHVGGSSGVAGLPGGFCRGLQQAGGQFRKSQQVRARCRAAGVAYQRVQPRDRQRVRPGRGVPS